MERPSPLQAASVGPELYVSEEIKLSPSKQECTNRFTLLWNMVVIWLIICTIKIKEALLYSMAHSPEREALKQMLGRQ